MLNPKILLLAGMLLCLTGQVYAQKAYLDSLGNELKKPLPDTTRMGIMLDLAEALRYSDMPLSRSYSRQAYAIAKKELDYYAMVTAINRIGHTFYGERKYDSALHYYRLGGELGKKDKTRPPEETAVMTNCNIASVLLAQGNYQPAVSAYLKAIDILKKYDAPEKWNNIGTCYLSVGIIYSDLKQDDKALSYYMEGLKSYRKQEGTEAHQAHALLYIESCLLDLKRYEEAKEYLDEARGLAEKLQSAGIFMLLYKNEGLYYRRINDYTNAILSFKEALKITRQIGEKLREQYVLSQIGATYRAMKEYIQSERYFEDALVLARKFRHKHDELEILKNVAGISSSLHHDSKAVSYYRQYILLNDSLNESETRRKINEIENKYQAEKKQDSILVLQKSNQVQQLALHKKKTLNIFLIISFSLLLLIILLVYRNLRNRHSLLKQNELLQNQRISELEKERQLVAAHSVMKGQEQERSRLARDLHDGVGGLLSGVKLSLSTMRGNVFLSEESAGAFNNVLARLDQSMIELRRVSHNMMPEALIKYGLKEALENYCENLNLSGEIKIRLQTYGMEKRMDQSTEIVLYRIVQELLNNVIKHAEAKNVLIQLMQEEDRFSLTVEDDGKGFNVSDGLQKTGAGLSNIKARVDYLGGTVDFRSVQGEGTSVNIVGKC